MISRVFVYGTLMSGGINHSIISPYCKTSQPARVAGLLYHLPYGFPAYAACGSGTVKGELVELNHAAKALAALDKLEDYYGPGCPDNLYNRIIMPVITAAGEVWEAYLYEWNNKPPLQEIGILIASGDWRADETNAKGDQA